MPETKIRIDEQTKGNLPEERVQFSSTGHNHDGTISAPISHNSLIDVSPDQHHSKLHQSSHQSGGEDSLTGNLDANARVRILRGGVSVGIRRGVNFIPGDNITLNVVDDSVNEKIDVTISATAGSSLNWAKEFKDDWDGVQNSWTLSNTPIDDNHLGVFKNGIFLRPGHDYDLLGNTITFITPPKTGDITAAWYMY